MCQDNRPIQLDKSDDYHLSTDLVDHAIADVRDHVSSAQERPFFLYLAFGACHWPHHVPREYIERYKGKYDCGWDVIRAQRLKKQLELGIVPAETGLAPLNPGVQAWNEFPADERELLARLQETYAGFLEHTDDQVGRLVDYLDGIGQLDNTLIVLLSDNGASPEGGPTGAINLRKHMVYEQESPQVGIAHLDKIGSELAYNHYPTGWAQVSNTPLKWYKKNVHGGGVRTPLIMHWPGRIADPGVMRHQYHHVIDIAPTLYEIMDIQAPEQYKGVSQLPVHGISMSYTFTDRQAPTRKESQIFELLGDRAIWHQGWKAVARHPKGLDFDLDEWELYHLSEDFSEISDLAKQQPEKLRKLVALWWDQANKYGVLPLDDRDWERAAERLKMNQTHRYEFHSNMSRVDRMLSPDITDRSYVIKATFDVTKQPVHGVLLAWGSHFGGFVLYLKEDRLCYEYVYSESVTHRIESVYRPEPGAAVVELHFLRTGKSAGRVTLLADGNKVGEINIPKTWPTHGTTAGLNCGQDAGAPVSFAYKKPFHFNGAALKVTVELATDSESEVGAAYAAALKEQ